MTPKEFCDWLKGFYEGIETQGGLEYNDEIVLRKLKEVKEPYTFIPYIPPIGDGLMNPAPLVQTAELSWNNPAFT